MTQAAIEAAGLTKAYRIGAREERAETLVGTVAALLRSPLHNLHQLRRLTRIGPADADTEDLVWALRGVSFRVIPGETLGIIGRNGAGKSSLLKVLSGITEPTAGRAVVRGQVASLLEVGTGFHPELTGRENVYLNGTILGMRKREVDRKFDEIVAFAEVERFIDTPIKRYSTGMTVRLAFAVAAHLEAEILLIDEVLAVGDAAFQRKCLGRMEEAAGRGRTVLFVSHNMAAVTSLCDRVLWLDDGAIREEGAPQRAVASYLAVCNPSRKAISWDLQEAPGTEDVRIVRVAVAPAGPDRTVITTDDPVTIIVVLWRKDPTRMYRIALHLANELGIVVLGASSAESSDTAAVAPGAQLRFFGTVPAPLLNSGTYTLRLLIGDDKGRNVHIEDGAVSFRVEEGDRGGTAYFGRRAGVVRPPVTWRIESFPEPHGQSGELPEGAACSQEIP